MIEDLKIVMKANNLTMEFVSREIGVSLNTVFRWLKGKNKPHKVFRDKIEGFLRDYSND